MEKILLTIVCRFQTIEIIGNNTKNIAGSVRNKYFKAMYTVLQP